MSFCNCDDWKKIKEGGYSPFKWYPPYGWVITWKELTDEVSHSQVHTYGISISFCPMCGKKLSSEEPSGH